MNKYDIAAYIWPAYTGDEPRTKLFWPNGIGEWQSVQNAKCKFDGHNWPRKPLWGYQNEADSNVMQMQIDAAHEHGVNVFIYDWYWFDRRPFLENCLNDGYLKANNNDKVKFYLMWANHDVNYTWDIRNNKDENTLVWQGAVDLVEFKKICERLITKYFKLPNYYTLNGKPVFMIYDLHNLINGLGGVEEGIKAFEWLREKAVEEGLSGIHLQGVVYSDNFTNTSGIDSSVKTISQEEIIKKLKFDSITHYQFAHFVDIDRDYNDIMVDVTNEWDKIKNKYDIPYFTHVSVGWDNNPRFEHIRGGIIKNNTPENFENALRLAKQHCDLNNSENKLITLNSWNEWTETSYLLPDDLYGYGYLNAVKNVFKS